MPLAQVFAFTPKVLTKVRSYAADVRDVIADGLGYTKGGEEVVLSPYNDVVLVIHDSTGDGNHGAGIEVLFDIQPDTKPERDDQLPTKGDEIKTLLEQLLENEHVCVRLTPVPAIWCE